MTTLGIPLVTTPPAIEPLTISQAKKQVEVSEGDTAHDEHLSELIVAAREQWEEDTDSYCLTQTLQIQTDRFCDELRLAGRPIQSIASISYYDTGNSLQTLSTDIYNLDKRRRLIHRQYSKSWPATVARWDAVTVNYVVGFTDPAFVPQIAKQAMLLLVAYYFNANRGDNDRPNDLAAYEKLVVKYMRDSYP